MPADSFPLALTLAVILDMLLGDPLWLPHPIRWMGKAIERLEPGFRSLAVSPRVAGGLMTGLLVAGVWLISWLVVVLSNAIHPALGLMVQAVMLFTCISARS
ncbi:cobalamin biosynthesis protein, partial [Desulfosarcina cetonica]|uniref:cobalamin biosynthesis protein n=1 Tax=Desulfosarcina cetonica TaxID=90730 RepID=UPI00155D90FA